MGTRDAVLLLPGQRDLLNWRFNGIAMPGDATVTDTQALLAVGRNKAANFNGTTQYLSRASEAALQAGDIDFSFAGWVMLHTTAGNQFILAKDSGVAGEREYLLAYNAGFVFSVFRATDTEFQVIATTFGAATAYTWYFVYVAHNAATDKVRISVNDGTVDTAVTTGALQAASAAGFGIANRGSLGTFLMSGRVASLGFWKRLLTIAEITRLYNNGYGRVFSDLSTADKVSLAAWWNLQEASGTRASSEGSTLTLTDTGSCLWANGPTLSGVPGIVCSGGKATPAWGDPRAVTTRSYRRRAGLTADFAYTAITGALQASQLGFFTTATPTGANGIGFSPYTTGGVYHLAQDGENVSLLLPISYVVDTTYWFRVQLLSAGARYYYSTDSGVTWQILWSTALGTTSVLYIAYVSYLARFRNTPAIVRRRSVKPALYASSTPGSVTPTLGAELATGNLVVGTWYSITATQANYFYTGCAVGHSFRATATTALDANNKVKAITFATCFGASLVAVPAANAHVRFTVPTLTAGTQAGIAFKYTDSDNCVIAYHDRTNASVIQYAAGVYSLLAGPTAATYGAATELRACWVSSTSLRVYYGATAIGGLLTIAAGVSPGTEIRRFSTLAANEVTLVESLGELP